MDRAHNLYLFAVRENADEKRLAEIDAALEPPSDYRVDGKPAWYDEDDAWESFANQLGR